MSGRYSFKNFNATNMVVGPKAKIGKASVKQAQIYQVTPQLEPVRAQGLHELDRFIMLVPSYGEDINSPDIIANAEAARAALSKRRLRRDRIEKLLATISVAVGGITTLAEAINAVQNTVSRLFS